MVKKNMVKEQSGVYDPKTKTAITVDQLEEEMEELRKKLFIYESLQAEKEIKNKQVKGPFQDGKEIINLVK